MDSEGITRAWPTAPLISRKTRPTQNQASASRPIFSFIVNAGCFVALFFAACLAFMFHRYRRRFAQLAVCCAFSHFELHQVGGIISRVAGRTKVALGVIHCLLQSGHRNVAERIRPEEAPNLSRRIRRSN